jgi:hypothetical protein
MNEAQVDQPVKPDHHKVTKFVSEIEEKSKITRH